MNARKAAIGLSLLCAILFSALAASSAMAIPGTTAHTCVKEGKTPTGEHKFTDEHCAEIDDVAGKWVHEEIKPGTATPTTGTNAKTGPKTESAVVATLRGKAFLTTVTLSATGVHSEGSLTNETFETTRMRAKGTSKIRYTGVKVTSLPKCTVKGEEVIAEANVRTATNATEMWVEAEGKGAEELFAEIPLEGAECALKGNTLKVRGIAIGTPNGATLEFKEKEPKNTLRVGLEKAGTSEYIGVETLRMAPVEGKEQNPISVTTTAE